MKMLITVGVYLVKVFKQIVFKITIFAPLEKPMTSFHFCGDNVTNISNFRRKHVTMTITHKHKVHPRWYHYPPRTQKTFPPKLQPVLLTQHLAEISVVQVRILVCQFLPLHLCPDHEGIHGSPYPRLLGHFLSLSTNFRHEISPCL